MGQSLVYLNEPNKEIEQEKGSNQYMSYATGSMQGWRLNMVSASNDNSLLLTFLHYFRRTLILSILNSSITKTKLCSEFLMVMVAAKSPSIAAITIRTF
jgi:hypothetical protein